MGKSRTVTVSALQFACTDDEYGRKFPDLYPKSILWRLNMAYSHLLELDVIDESSSSEEHKYNSYSGNCYPEMTEVEINLLSPHNWKLKVAPLSSSGICWDQWFPEAVRVMLLQGSEILFYPTAIGSEPQDEGLDSRDHWKCVMQGHTGANMVSFLDELRLVT
ncbi:UNVERIFIED_CONTAM: N-carbamoylputrescine amidase [Sesamum latifolium]|uniref:N-carbamoylputrescine amidase n=1 Tax=Sesamum latifolium TaxID=2727402 RepID=A0AAW2Y2V7_9LAMI